VAPPETTPAAPAPAGRFRLPVPVLGGAFAVILGIYVLLVGGIVVADLVYVAGTEAGHREIRELLFIRIPGPAEQAGMPKPRQLYYEELAHRRQAVLHSIWLSVWTSSLAAAISLVIAVPAGYVLSRGRFRGVGLLDAVVDVPIILPPLLFGIRLLVLFQRTGLGPALQRMGIKIVFQPAGIVLVQVLIATAYGTRMLKATFDGIDPRLAAVAMTLGATRARAFFTVTLASARSGLVAALVMIWARGLALYGPIIAFVGSTSLHTEVMPTRMYLEMSVGRLEAALFIALLMMAMAGVVLLVLKLATGRSADQVSRMLRL
jgi:molybdate transport system permease protein